MLDFSRFSINLYFIEKRLKIKNNALSILVMELLISILVSNGSEKKPNKKRQSKIGSIRDIGLRDFIEMILVDDNFSFKTVYK